jgi:hypothetical protein
LLRDPDGRLTMRAQCAVGSMAMQTTAIPDGALAGFT